MLHTRALVLATGARYRRLEVEHLETFEGSNIHYWAWPLEGRLCSGQEVVVVGGGNSAGQATVCVPPSPARCGLLLRSKDLRARMSSYLANRIRFLDNVEVVPQPDVTALEGENGFLGGGRWCRQGLSEVRRPIRLVFLFIGAEPNCAWLADAGVAVDGSGFVPTGTREGTRTLETSHPGVFAIGDIRSGSAKRVATAVGDGAQVVANLHVYLATLDGRETRPPQGLGSLA